MRLILLLEDSLKNLPENSLMHFQTQSFACTSILSRYIDNLIKVMSLMFRECSGSVVERLTQDGGVAGLSLTGVTVFFVLEQDTFILA